MGRNLKIERELLSPPGDDLLEHIRYIRMSQVELADRLGKTPSKVNDLITGKEPITYATALQLEHVLGLPAEYWLSRERQYREKLTRLEEAERLAEDEHWVADHPLRQLRACGYISRESKGPDLVAEMLGFYGVASTARWANRYVDAYTTVQFRKSAAQKTMQASLAAWLRIGEIQMQSLQLPDYDPSSFRQVLDGLRPIIRQHPSDFAAQLQERCAKAGVAVIYTPCLPKTGISGATRWFRGRPLIQLTDRYKTNDQFWFTFFHEAGHVLLHGRKDVFLEHAEGYVPDEQKENEANAFAADHLLPEHALSTLPRPVTASSILNLAESARTHPGIIVGRLQRLGLIRYSHFNRLKATIDLSAYAG